MVSGRPPEATVSPSRTTALSASLQSPWSTIMLHFRWFQTVSLLNAPSNAKGRLHHQIIYALLSWRIALKQRHAHPWFPCLVTLLSTNEPALFKYTTFPEVASMWRCRITLISVAPVAYNWVIWVHDKQLGAKASSTWITYALVS